MKSEKSNEAAGKLIRLSAFAVICAIGGVGVLFCLFAPSTNPSMVTGVVFQADPLKVARAPLTIGKIPRALKELDASFNHPFTDQDFEKLGIAKPDDVTFKTADGTQLHGWFFTTAGAHDTVLLNWSGFGDVRYAAALGYVRMLQQAHFSVFVYDYRGLGQSQGKSTLASGVEDGLAAYDYLTKEKKIDPKQLILMGREMGSYVACQISHARPCACMILEEPWINLKNWVDARSPIMSMVPLSLYPGDGLSNLALLKDKHPPLLIVSTDIVQDGPGELYNEIPAPKRMLTVDQDCSMFLNLKRHSASRYAKHIDALVEGVPEPQNKKRPVTSSPGPITWTADLTDALAKAKVQKKHVLVDVYTDWCHWCKVLDKKTYTDSNVQSYVNQNFIAVKANAEDGKSGQALAEKYAVNAYPTILVLDSSGAVLSTLSGFAGPERFITRLENAIED